MLDKTIEQEFRKISDHYVKNNPSILCTIAYGSQIYGKPTADSHFDFWFVIDKYRKFHIKRKKDYKNYKYSLLRRPAAHMTLNKINPNFYQDSLDNKEVKYGVVTLRDFIKGCSKKCYKTYIKGRFHKPVKIIYSKDEYTRNKIEKAILKVRKDGLKQALNLSGKTFTFDNLLTNLVSLSYIADIRPESPDKIVDIIKNSMSELKEIYTPLLEEENLTKKNEFYINESWRWRSMMKTLIYLKGNSLVSLFYNLKNGLTNKKSVSYVLRKLKRTFKLI